MVHLTILLVAQEDGDHLDYGALDLVQEDKEDLLAVGHQGRDRPVVDPRGLLVDLQADRQGFLEEMADLRMDLRMIFRPDLSVQVADHQDHRMDHLVEDQAVEVAVVDHQGLLVDRPATTDLESMFQMAGVEMTALPKLWKLLLLVLNSKLKLWPDKSS